MDKIRAVQFFDVLDADVLSDKLAQQVFTVKDYAKGTVVHFEGERCENFELVLSGKISIDRISEAGHLLTVTHIPAGGILGVNLLFSKAPYYPMTIVAHEHTQLLVISRDEIFSLLTSHPALLQKYLEWTSDNAAILSNKVKYTARTSLRETILHFLQTERQQQHSKTITLNLTKKQLAEHFGVQRTSLSRELAKMRQEGLITFDAKSITLLQ